MYNCQNECKPEKNKKWNKKIREILSTPNYNIKKTKFMINRLNRPILDIRKTNINKNIYSLPKEQIVLLRLDIEKKLHNIFLKTSQVCVKQKCSLHPINRLYINFIYNNKDWILNCDSDEISVGLCKYPVVNFLKSQLLVAILEADKLFPNSCCLPIHISWSFKYQGNIFHHATTLVVNNKCKTTILFDPLGTIVNLPLIDIYKLKNNILKIINIVCESNDYKFKGYITPDINFQDDNPDMCFVWTSWLELLVVINPWLTTSELKNYLRYIYSKWVIRQSRKLMITYFIDYLSELR